jgi:hypothetical protein
VDDLMDKKTYYVSVQAGTVLEDMEAAPFEFVIEATPKELDKLQVLFEEKDEADDDTFTRGMTPAIPYHQDVQNDAYDASLKRVYRYIYELGTPETRKHIESMGVLDETTPNDDVTAYEPVGAAPDPGSDNGT